jgi:hypothetical protein
MRYQVQVGDRGLCSRRGEHRQLGHFLNFPVPSVSSQAPSHKYNFQVMMEGCFHTPGDGNGWFIIGNSGCMSALLCPCSVSTKV